jgi:hypothetical protein
LRARFVESVEQAGVQALREEDVSGDTGLHHPFTVQQRRF